MKKILEQLNKEVGVKGSMVITPDGFMVASALGPELEEEFVAAIVSSVILAIRKALQRVSAPAGMDSCILHATKGKIMFFDVGSTFLVVVADSHIKIDNSLIAIRSAIHRIQNRRVA